ncbi:MAG: ATP-grasp domain-containing protein [Anaerolineae bacterium]|nr:ATP-grasp domain-containing protein [Anaerolineae bacterium]
MTTIGSIGGGPAARYLGIAAAQLGFSFVVHTPHTDDIASATANAIIAPYELDALKLSLSACDVITVLDHHVPDNVLEDLAVDGLNIVPGTKIISLLADRLTQRRHWQQAGYDIARFRRIGTGSDVLESAQEFGYPVVLKKRYPDHDGRDRIWIRRAGDIEPAVARWQNEPLLIDAPVSGVRELAVTLVRAADGSMMTYPVVQITRQHDQVFSVACPASIDEATAYRAVELARELVENLEGVGAFTLSMIELPMNEVMLSEVFAGPHPLADYTLEGTITSQYENHLRAILGLPLGDVYQIAPAVATVMIVDSEAVGTSGLDMAAGLATGGAHIHVYGYTETHPGRVLGHITTLGYEADAAEKVGRLALSHLLPTKE